jgi:hypothetical protein
MCYRCHEAGHLANGCPNIVKQQEEPQAKPQVEQEKTPQEQVKINHKDSGDLMMMKKKIRRSGRSRHPTLIQDAKMLSKNPTKKMRKSKEEKKKFAHIKCFKCEDLGHFASKCPTKLEKKAQATHERQGNEKHHMSNEDKAQSKRKCYSCQERGHIAHSCPIGNNSKLISIDDNIVLRKDGNGTSLVIIAKHPAIYTKVMPKYVAPNLRGLKLVWVPSKSG